MKLILFSRFYSDAWLHEDPNRVSPHRDAEISEGRIKCFRKLFPDPQDFKQAMEEFGMFSFKSGPYTGGENLYCRSTMDPILWLASFGSSTPIIQAVADLAGVQGVQLNPVRSGKKNGNFIKKKKTEKLYKLYSKQIYKILAAQLSWIS